MLLMTEIAPQIYELIMDLVNKGKYTSVESFVDVSIRNQITIEKSSSQEIGRKVTEIPPEKSSHSALHQLRRNMEQNLLTVPSISVDQKRRTEPMWGLINRLVPAKVVLRMLVNALAQSKTQWLDFRQFSDEVVTISYQIRNQTEKFERRSDVVRGQSLKIGFPMKDRKSQQRFVDLFIGKLRGENQLGGLLGDLELIALRRSQQGSMNNTIIGITESGLQWANMDSPFIDDFISSQKPIQRPLSYEETHFLLSRIKETKPGDYEFLKYIYKLVREGVNTPDKLTDHTAMYLESLKLNPALFNTFQTGGIARLVEMRIIQLDKNGIHTRYAVTSTASSLEELRLSIAKYRSNAQEIKNEREHEIS